MPRTRNLGYGEGSIYREAARVATVANFGSIAGGEGCRVQHEQNEALVLVGLTLGPYRGVLE